MLQFGAKKNIRYDKRAIKEISRFPLKVREVVHSFLLKLSLDGSLSEPESKKLKGTSGLYELRVRYKGAWRVLYVYWGADTVLILSAFRKKTQRTQLKEFDKAQNRLNQYKML